MCLGSLLACRYVLSKLSRAQNAPRYPGLGVCSQAWAPQLASLGSWILSACHRVWPVGPQASRCNPKVSIIELLAPKMLPKWSPKSTLFATGRQSENRAPAAARTLLSTLDQIPKLMKKRFWFGVPARALPFQLLKPASIKKDASSPQNEL